MLRLVHEERQDENNIVISEVSLLDDQNKPTALLVGLLIMEIGIDFCVGYLVYRFFSRFKLGRSK